MAQCVSAPAPVVRSAIVTCEALAIAATEMTATEMRATEWATEVSAATKMGGATGPPESDGAEREG